jgi:flagellar hook-associated protein 2
VLGSAAFTNPVTAGTLTVNGQQITVATTDTLQDVFNNIFNATGGAVTGSYDASTDKITLAGTGEVVLGSAADTSNFFTVARLENNGTGTVTSDSGLGSVQLTGDLANSNLSTPITDGGGGAGEFRINGVSISYNASTDSINDVLTRINNSGAGVSASYDAVNDRFQLTNRTTGDVGVSLQDVTGNFLAATGLSGGTLRHGTNLVYSVNGGGQLTSQSNTITSASSGINGLSVTALKGNSTVSVTVGIDTTKITSAINSFLAAYDNVQSYIDTQTASSTDSTGKVTAGVLANDRSVSDLAKSLRENAFNPSSGLAGTVKSLADIGIQSSGLSNSLNLADSAKLNDALTNNIADVTAMFTDATNGMTTKLNAYLTNTIGNAGDGGTLVTEQSNLTKQSTGIDTQVANLEKIVQSDITRWNAEFAAMESAQSASNQQLTYLQKQFP